jgi:tRNA nucleotidyltransferase (CCA-adding enzyme)
MAAHPEALLDDWLALRRLELSLSDPGSSRLASLAELAARLAAQRAQKPALSVGELALSGQDLLRTLQLPAGPRVGQTLRHLLQCVLEDPAQNQRDWLLAEAARYLASEGG